MCLTKTKTTNERAWDIIYTNTVNVLIIFGCFCVSKLIFFCCCCFLRSFCCFFFVSWKEIETETENETNTKRLICVLSFKLIICMLLPLTEWNCISHTLYYIVLWLRYALVWIDVIKFLSIPNEGRRCGVKVISLVHTFWI